MKVKCVKTCGHIGVTLGKVYNETGNLAGYIYIKNDNSAEIAYPDYLFERVNEAHKIEVGSEWNDVEGGLNTSFRVDYIGDQRAFITNEVGEELSVPLNQFGKAYQPKPKTVTMYFYKLGTQLCACEVKPAATPVLFTREIEL